MSIFGYWSRQQSYLLLAHFSGTGRESSLPDVSSVVASGRSVVMSIGIETATPSATHRLRNFSILPKQFLISFG